MNWLKARQTAGKYRNTLAEHGFLTKHRAGKHNYDINPARVRLFLAVRTLMRKLAMRQSKQAVEPFAAGCTP